MQLGTVLYRLWHRRLVLGLSIVIAALAGVLSAYRISTSGLTPRSIGMSTATTQVLVDNPDSIVLDLDSGTFQLSQMSQSAALLGNVMVSYAVREDIARRVGVPVGLIETSAPATPAFPQAVTAPNRKTTDLIASNDQYRINVQVNPTVPILDIYTEAHSPAIAKALANAAVAGLRDYVSGFAQSIPVNQRVEIEQLGPAEGGAVTGGLRVEVIALVFGFALVFCCVAGTLLDRVRRGWRAAADDLRLHSRFATSDRGVGPA